MIDLIPIYNKVLTINLLYRISYTAQHQIIYYIIYCCILELGIFINHYYSMQNKLPPKCINILLNLRRALINYKITFQDLIKKIFGTTKQYLIDKQFEKIIKFGDLKLTFSEIDMLFSLLQQNGRIQVEVFTKLLQGVQTQDKSIDNQNGNIIDPKLIAMKEVKYYLKQNGPYEVFDSFDSNKDGGLDIEQLNDLFKGCSQTLAKNKEVRVGIIRILVQKLPYNIINTQQFLGIFGLQHEPKRVSLKEPLEMMKSRLDIDLKKMYITKNQPVQQVKPTFPPQMKKQQVIKLPNQSKKQQLPKVKQQNVFQPTPSKNYSHLKNALNYYRLEQKYVQILELIEYYLNSKQIFLDSENPKTSKGEFVAANKVFKGKFSLIQVAQSVVEREKNRRGLGLQFQAKDIIQGSVGNCYLLSSLTSVVDRHPEFVSNYFLFNVNPSGIYVVRLFNDGQWSNIVLDDRFPCSGNRPIYAKPHGNEIWVMLLQKAWAKLHGSYQNIDLGSSQEAFIALTGAPCKYLRQEEEKEKDIKSFIMEGFSRKGMITCSGSPKLNTMPKQESEKYGLIGNHAYSILNVYSVFDNQKKSAIEIIRIRNPWGNLQWKGNWSFSSNKWTPELRQKYNYVKNPNDGSFYMSWDDFSIYFSSITICYMQPHYINSSLRVMVDRHQPSYITFKINTSGKYVFSIYQQSKRKYLHKGVYQLSQNYMYIAKDGDDYQYIQSGSKSQNNLHVEQHFEAGVYIAKFGLKWNYFNSHECVITSYGPSSVVFKQLKGAPIQPKFTSDIIRGFSNKHKGQISNYSKIGIAQATRQLFFSIQHGLGYIKIQNPSNKQFTSTINLKQNKGLKLFDLFQMPLKSVMSPKSEQIYGFATSAKGYSYSLQEHLTYKN